MLLKQDANMAGGVSFEGVEFTLILALILTSMFTLMLMLILTLILAPW